LSLSKKKGSVGDFPAELGERLAIVSMSKSLSEDTVSDLDFTELSPPIISSFHKDRVGVEFGRYCKLLFLEGDGGFSSSSHHGDISPNDGVSPVILHDKFGTNPEKDTGFGEEFNELRELFLSRESGVKESLRCATSSSLEDSVIELLHELDPIAFDIRLFLSLKSLSELCWSGINRAEDPPMLSLLLDVMAIGSI